MPTAVKKYSVLFVCLGNICRSPLGRAVLEHLAEKRGFGDKLVVDSCGTGDWHVGERAHPGSIAVAKKNGVSLVHHRARQVCLGDFTTFDLLVAMDRSNLKELKSVTKKTTARLICLREYDTASNDLDVPDPYYTGGFQEVYEIIHRCCENLLDEIEHNILSAL